MPLPSSRLKGLAFYEAAAQIIPVLLLVLALERNILEESTADLFYSVVPGLKRYRRYTGALARIDFIVSVALLLFVVFAEAVALDVLTDERAAAWQHTVIEAAVLTQLGWIFATAVSYAGRRQADEETDGSDPIGR